MGHPRLAPGWQVHVARAVGFGLAGALGFGLAFGLNSTGIGFAPAALVGAPWGGITCGLAFGLALSLIGKLTGEPHTLALRPTAARRSPARSSASGSAACSVSA